MEEQQKHIEAQPETTRRTWLGQALTFVTAALTNRVSTHTAATVVGGAAVFKVLFTSAKQASKEIFSQIDKQTLEATALKAGVDSKVFEGNIISNTESLWTALESKAVIPPFPYSEGHAADAALALIAAKMKDMPVETIAVFGRCRFKPQALAEGQGGMREVMKAMGIEKTINEMKTLDTLKYHTLTREGKFDEAKELLHKQEIFEAFDMSKPQAAVRNPKVEEFVAILEKIDQQSALAQLSQIAPALDRFR
jgi:hypothetical protein